MAGMLQWECWVGWGVLVGGSDQIQYYYKSLIRKMMSSDSLSRTYLYVLFVLSIAAEVFAVVLMSLLAGFDYIGFNGNTQISGTCPTTTSYYGNKYTQIGLIEETAFIFSILSLAAFSVVLAVMIKCVVEARKQGQAELLVGNFIKVLLYVLTSVAILCAIPPFGHYFSIIVDIKQCSPATYDSSKLSSVFAIATVLFVLLLVFFVLLFLAFCTASEEKYREVSRHHTHHTEVVQNVKRAQEVQYFNRKRPEKEEPYKKQPDVYEKRTPQEMERISPPKRVANRADELEHTKENLYNSPPRPPTINTYSKEVDPRPFLHSPERKYEPARQPAPVLQPKAYVKQTYPSESPQKYVSPSRVPENQGELMFHKKRTRGMPNDEQEFSKEQSKYLNRYADRPILSSGVKEVNNRERGIADGFHAGELPRAGGNSNSPVRGGREKSLVNYIRGKYAD